MTDPASACAASEDRSRDIVAPTPPALGGMAWAHPIAPIIVKFACEKGFGISAGIRPRLRLRCKLMLDAIPGLLVDDCGMQAVVDLPLMAKPSDIDRV